MKELKRLIEGFISLIPLVGEKGDPMGKNNPFNGLSKELDVTYAGSKVLEPSYSFLNTSPIISFGLGRFSAIPWIVFTSYGQEVMNGIYPVLLFYLDEKKVLLCYGISESNMPQKNWSDNLINNKLKVDDVISKPERYGSSIVYKSYDIEELNESAHLNKILEDLTQIINDYHNCMSEDKKPENEIDQNIIDFVQKEEKVEIQQIADSFKLSKSDTYGLVRKLYQNGKIDFEKSNKLKLQLETSQLDLNNEALINYLPNSLITWGANKPTAVRIPFSESSGRPAGKVIKNKLIHTLDNWIEDTNGISNILLVGGPGNGKTDALEYLVDRIISEYNLSTEIRSQMSKMVLENKRDLIVEIEDGNNFPFRKIVAIPEASTGTLLTTKEESLFNDFKNYLEDSDTLYISCINRGILEDLKIYAHSKNNKEILSIIESINSSTKGEGAESWPLPHRNEIAVWFMDIESLFDASSSISPSQQILEVLKNEKKWDWYKEYPVLMEQCPFYENYQQLMCKESTDNLNSILKNYETITENKLNFRNYFSLLSSLFAMNNGDGVYPIEFSLKNINLINSSIPKEYEYIKSIFNLSFACYTLRLFRDWNKPLEDFSSIIDHKNLNDSPLLSNFLRLCGDDKIRNSLGTFQSEYERKFIEQITNVMDPYYSDHPEIIELTELFSISILDGHRKIENELTYAQGKLIDFLRMVEEEIKLSNDYKNSRNQLELMIQKVRSFAALIGCRVIGTKRGLINQYDTLNEYHTLLGNFDSEKERLKKMFKGITKTKDIFPIHSFGQPKKDSRKSIIIRAEGSGSKFQIKAAKTNFNRPNQNAVFFEHSKTGLIIPLSYNLYKALREINSGVDKNSVNSNINSLIERMESLLYSQYLHVGPEEYDELKLFVREEQGITIDELNLT